MISYSNFLSRGSGTPIQVGGVLVRAMSGTELSRVRTQFRPLLPEPINKSPLESREPTLLCNQVKCYFTSPVTRLIRTHPLSGRNDCVLHNQLPTTILPTGRYPAEFYFATRIISGSEDRGRSGRRDAQRQWSRGLWRNRKRYHPRSAGGR
jgi:hypothetical protein